MCETERLAHISGASLDRHRRSLAARANDPLAVLVVDRHPPELLDVVLHPRLPIGSPNRVLLEVDEDPRVQAVAARHGVNLVTQMHR